MAVIPPTEQHRAYLFSIAYRMLGSISDAEDILQECFLRWRELDVTEIRAPRSYLATMITRLCMEHMRKAHVRRETYVGPWLPEPLMTAQALPEPEVGARHEQLEQISMAFLLMLERLSPVERAAFLLRKAFDYDYSEIASVIEKSESNCRQIVRRAQLQMDELEARKPRFSSDQEEQTRIMSQFVASCSSGDLDGLVSLLAEDVVFTSDSNGKAKAARRPVYGVEKVARLALSLTRKMSPELSLQVATLNASPALIHYQDNEVHSATLFDIREGRITAIYTTVNPDKLQHLRLQ